MLSYVIICLNIVVNFNANTPSPPTSSLPPHGPKISVNGHLKQCYFGQKMVCTFGHRKCTVFGD